MGPHSVTLLYPRAFDTFKHISDNLSRRTLLWTHAATLQSVTNSLQVYYIGSGSMETLLTKETPLCNLLCNGLPAKTYMSTNPRWIK